MKLLFLNACVRENSRTEVLCRDYMEKMYAGAESVTELYLPELSLQPMTREAIAKREQDCARQDFSAPEYENAKLFAQADEILIGAPFWDCSFPSILKVFFEHICVNGVTFGYGADGVPLQLCKAKRMVYITSSGGYIPKHNSLQLYIRELCGMFGIDDLMLYSAQGLDIVGNDADSIIQKLKDQFKRLAQNPVTDASFVRVRDYIPEILVDLRYAGSQNFTGKKIYDFSDAWLRYGTVKKLEKAQQILKNQGYGLKIWDAFRPISAQFVLWEVCPDSTYVADPVHGFSDHSRGNTVDVTLVDRDEDEIVMPTLFDSFSKMADRDYRDVPDKEAVVNSWLLQETMIEAGFLPYHDEWWHFSDKDQYEPERNFSPELED